MITTNCGAGVKTPTPCSEWSQILQPPVPGTLVRSSCAVGFVHLLLFQKSLCRELLLEAGIHTPGWCCPCRLGDSYLPHPAVPSDPQRDSIPWVRPSCVQFPGHRRNSDQHRMSPRQNVQQGGTRCSGTLAEDSHTMGHHTLSPRAHSLCAFLILPVVLPLLQADSLLDFSVEAWPLKKINWIWNVSKDFKLDPEVWVNDLKNQCLQIRGFTGSAKFDSYCWWRSQPWFLGWLQTEEVSSWVYGELLCLWTGRNQESLISRARWTLWYWILQLPNTQFDLLYLLGLIIFTPFPAS